MGTRGSLYERSFRIHGADAPDLVPRNTFILEGSPLSSPNFSLSGPQDGGSIGCRAVTTNTMEASVVVGRSNRGAPPRDLPIEEGG